MDAVYILLVIANLGKAFTFEYSQPIYVYKTKKTCEEMKDKMLASKEYIRYECKRIDYDNR